MPDENKNGSIGTSDTQTMIAERILVPPGYFLSLSVENFRCFKQKQILNLSIGDEKPARWTLILGENGVGKTTLLQLMARMQPVEVLAGSMKKPHRIYTPDLFYNFNYKHRSKKAFLHLMICSRWKTDTAN